jgi:hypothetical protein
MYSIYFFSPMPPTVCGEKERQGDPCNPPKGLAAPVNPAQVQAYGKDPATLKEAIFLFELRSSFYLTAR